ncbi:hypothetical protein OQA88_7056 [Cercophora sp. LCS_1]
MRDQVRKLVKFVMNVKDVIGGAIAAEPFAAPIWAGVLVMLPILENMFQQDEDAAVGVKRISFLIIQFQLMEETWLSSQLTESARRPKFHEFAKQVEKKMVSMYTLIYRYQIDIVMHYAQSRLVQNAKNMRSTSWKSQVDSLENERDQVAKGMHALSDNRLSAGLQKIDRKLGGVVALQETMMKQVEDADQSNLLSMLPSSENATFDAVKNTHQTCLGAICRDMRPLRAGTRWMM